MIGGVVLLLWWGWRRAKRGAPPARPVNLAVAALATSVIQVGFYAAATAAPSVGAVVALVIGGWGSFLLFWVWLGRAPNPYSGPGRDEEGRGGGGGGGGPKKPPPPRGDGDGGGEWAAFEAEFRRYAAQSRERAPAEPVG